MLASILFVATILPLADGAAQGDESAASESTSPKDFFETKIRPVLVKHCYQCHAIDSDEVGGSLLIDHRAGMLTGGLSGPAMVPGQPDSSLIIQALRYEGIEMPPDDPLPNEVIDDFVKWIQQGAEDPRGETPLRRAGNDDQQNALWSFMPRQTYSVPVSANEDEIWSRDPIDAFVLDKLKHAGLQPTHDADSVTLIKRLYFDLIGLAPTREQVDAFVIDYQSAGQAAVSRLVDRLLADDQFGVRWGRHWLDVARYGESNGDDGLGRNASFPHAWRYRDYVIQAFNDDVPYDRFLTEQIAGDLLPFDDAAERNRLRIATGFLAIGSKPAAAMNSNFAMDIVDDQINAVCTGVMGLSVACARCHDHKHDPIPTRDYYAIAGIFSSTETFYGAGGNEKLTAPATPLHELYATLTEPFGAPDWLSPPSLSADYHTTRDALKPNRHIPLTALPEGVTIDRDATYSDQEFAAVKDTTFSSQLAEPARSYSVSFWFKNITNVVERPITAYLFSRSTMGDKTLPGDHLGIGGNFDKGRSGKLFVFNGNQSKQMVTGSTVIDQYSWNHVVFVRDAGHVRIYLNGRLEAEGDLKPTFGESVDFCIANRSDNFAPLHGNIGEFAFFTRSLTGEEVLGLHAASGQPRGIEPVAVVGLAMGVRDKPSPANTKIHIGGEGRKLGEEVPRGTLTAYRPSANATTLITTTPETSVHSQQAPSSSTRAWPYEVKIEDKQSGRLALAQWLTHAEHPQTSRVIVNRIWLHLFGQGIVATPDDFGVYGARPTHPELLDHLASRLVDEGWSLKRLIRAMVLSRTYQLHSDAVESLMQADPDNRLLSRHARRRLDAESLRDRILASAGTLDYSAGIASAISGLDALLNKAPHTAATLHRPHHHRSVYLCLLRNAPPQELAAFDLPDASTVEGMRPTTNLPTQALFLLNSDFVVEQSTALAERLVQLEPKNDAKRVGIAFDLMLLRDASDGEIADSLRMLREVDRSLADEVTDPDRRRLRVWSGFCHALMMTNEFRYID